MRVAAFFLAVLLEMTLCAIFTHVSPADDSVGGYFLVAFVSFFLGMGLLLVGLLLNSSSKMKTNLRRASNTNQLKKIYEGMKKKIKVKAIASLVFFVLVSAVLLLSIVCFSHLANDSMREDWMMSCVLVGAMDLVLFELVAGVLFGLFASCYGSF